MYVSVLETLLKLYGMPFQHSYDTFGAAIDNVTWYIMTGYFVSRYFVMG